MKAVVQNALHPDFLSIMRDPISTNIEKLCDKQYFPKD